ncbi:MAG: hypothetical protein ACE5GX_02410 [Thermoanaerobaculia bacterium]
MTRSPAIGSLLLGLGLFGLAAAPGLAVELRPTSCVTCHGDPDLFEAEALATLESFRVDVHAEVGLSCHDCHGGNPSASVADDMFAAKDDEFTLNPYRGAPVRTDVPRFCGHCHSDPSYMRRFRPDVRIDQEREYATSYHGIALAEGDASVATCIDCHGVHGVRRVSDPESPVYPTAVADTCSSCHSDAERMTGYTTSDGRPLPVNQHARWQQSVHAAAMIEREDLSAPTCNDCHGNHGASPPGLDSVTFVCGQCHGREAELFRESSKHEGFELHNEYLAEAGDQGCPACHEPPEPQVWVTGITHFGECTSCHENHGTVRPTVAMFGELPATPCVFCHEGPTGLEAQEPEGGAETYSQVLEELFAEATEEDLEGDTRFDWLVDQARVLDQHTVSGESDDQGRPLLRPEFSKLFDKFRIGKTYYTFRDPDSAEEVRAPITRCSSCHVSGAQVSKSTPGAVTGIDLLDRMSELTATIGRAERTVLRAHRGGVEVRDAQLEIDQAVDAEIGLEVRVHGFTVTEGSDFLETHAKGLEHAKAAIELGVEAQEEIQARRRWLALSLIAVVATLVALGLKIRELSRREARAAR